MNLVREWTNKLKDVEQIICDYNKILENNELTHEMKIFCYRKIESKTKYKRLIETTINTLKESEG
ncbi:hypothetical protein CLPU_10c01550 [Gottschalkia purinilytica]|uniref:Uncharacterized protein n=1 Tax=Gottschalkia purinilytica TaxID=1503 RepID=A0A0L0W9W4_GOTPU|nr:hypothetical protein [Gottschalkia purinilytica]KNF08100.1 hypothetical protein CLPU_10c01550 [Gottschalkia purinilytica]